VGIDLDTMLSEEQIQTFRDSMVNQGVIITDVAQDSTGKLMITFVNKAPVGVGALPVLTIVVLSVGAFVLMGMGIFGWQLWSALSKTPWYVWWIAAGGLVGGLIYLLIKVTKK